MDIKQLTQAMHDLVNSHGWYDKDSPRKQLPRNLAISLCLEAGEVLEHYQWGEKAHDRDGLKGELADVALYLLQLASIEKIDLEQAILDKIKFNYTRLWDQDRSEDGVT